MSLFSLHKDKIGRIVMCPLAIRFRFPMEIPLKVAFKQSLKESQYPELWFTFSYQKESNFNVFGMQPLLRPALVYGAQNLGNHHSQTNFK